MEESFTKMSKKPEQAKRKRVVLTIEDKIKIIQLLNGHVSYTIISEKYGIGRSTISDIKKNQQKIIAFKQGMIDRGTSCKSKVMRLGSCDKLDQAVFVWFKQKRMQGMPVSGSLLCEKATQLAEPMNITNFVASSGWKWRFCRRHGIRNLSLQGEKLSADADTPLMGIQGSRENFLNAAYRDVRRENSNAAVLLLK